MPVTGGDPLLSAIAVTRHYPARGRRWSSGAPSLAALDRVSLALNRGEILGVVGRSGAGKSTLARVLLGLERADGGEVAFRGRPIARLSASELAAMRRAAQIVFQDPAAALDPRQRVGAVVGEPLAVHALAARRERPERVAALLRQVGLPGDRAFLRRRPGELSGGERQRVAIARAMASGPEVVVLDEPVSSLDASVRWQVLDLLLDLHERAGLTMLLIAHDVALVACICTRVAVMAGGRIVEEGPPGEMLARPTNEATAELLAAARWLGGASPVTAPREPAPPG
jgi:ABC-type glutathione transport system ATPase component